jgi:hypothetical protein
MAVRSKEAIRTRRELGADSIRMLIEQSRTELKAAQAIQGDCLLTRVALVKSSVEVFGPEENFEAPLKLKFSHAASSVLIGRILRVRADFDFHSFDGSEEGIQVFDLGCTFELDYQLPENCEPTEEQLDAFKKGNAVYNCWPYVRELVQNITARMGFQPPPLPLLRVKIREDALRNEMADPAATNETPSASPLPS